MTAEVCGVTFSGFSCTRPKGHGAAGTGVGHSSGAKPDGSRAAWGPGVDGSSDHGQVPEVLVPGVLAPVGSGCGDNLHNQVPGMRVAESAMPIPTLQLRELLAAFEACVTRDRPYPQNFAQFELSLIIRARVLATLSANFEDDKSFQLSAMTTLDKILAEIVPDLLRNMAASDSMSWVAHAWLPARVVVDQHHQRTPWFPWDKLLSSVGGIDGVLETCLNISRGVLSDFLAGVDRGSITRLDINPQAVTATSVRERLQNAIFSAVARAELAVSKLGLFSHIPDHVYIYYWSVVATRLCSWINRGVWGAYALSCGMVEADIVRLFSVGAESDGILRLIHQWPGFDLDRDFVRVVSTALFEAVSTIYPGNTTALDVAVRSVWRTPLFVPKAAFEGVTTSQAVFMVAWQYAAKYARALLHWANSTSTGFDRLQYTQMVAAVQGVFEFLQSGLFAAYVKMQPGTETPSLKMFRETFSAQIPPVCGVLSAHGLSPRWDSAWFSEILNDAVKAFYALWVTASPFAAGAREVDFPYCREINSESTGARILEVLRVGGAEAIPRANASGWSVSVHGSTAATWPDVPGVVRPPVQVANTALSQLLDSLAELEKELPPDGVTRTLELVHMFLLGVRKKYASPPVETAPTPLSSEPDDRGLTWGADQARSEAALARLDAFLATVDGARLLTTLQEFVSESAQEKEGGAQMAEKQPEKSEKVEECQADPGVLNTLQTDATAAAWRTAGSQFVKLTRDPLVALLSRHLGPDDPALRARIAGFLSTEAGTACMAALLSVGLSALPRHSGLGPVAGTLALELRVKSMSTLGDLLADLLMGPLREVFALYLHGGVLEPAQLGAASPPVLREASVSSVRAADFSHVERSEK